MMRLNNYNRNNYAGSPLIAEPPVNNYIGQKAQQQQQQQQQRTVISDYIRNNNNNYFTTSLRSMTSPNDVDDESSTARQNHIGNSSPVEYNGYAFENNNNNTKIVLSNVPSDVSLQEVETMLTAYGTVQHCEKINRRDGPTQVVRVVFDTPEQAQQALTTLNNFTYQGYKLKAEPQMDRKARVPGGPRNARNGVPGFGALTRQNDFPLRILVPSEMVGAIIGRQGSTIRQITQQTRASRVDVHRKDNLGSVEKAITIYGNPENCTNACKKILEVMQQEASNTSKSDITLKILAHNNLIGRIIGKGGNTIKRIMQETDTKIAVSSLVPPNVKFDVFSFRNLGELNPYNMERIITVKGTIDNMAKAEGLISAKLRQSYENDMQAMSPQSLMFPGIPPMTVMATAGLGYNARNGPTNYPTQLYGAGPIAYPPIYQPGPPPPTYNNNTIPPADAQETVFLYIPNQAVGAIIGTKGSQIKNMIRFSNASIKIATAENEKIPDSNERKVTIVGIPEAQWKAQYMIFEKMREEGFTNGIEEVRLTVEILVPSNQVGRIIGKGGHNVRELQRMTGANIKLPEHNVNNPTPSSDEEVTTVHIIGQFLSVQSAQRRIRSMINTGPVNRVPRPPRGPVDVVQQQ